MSFDFADELSALAVDCLALGDEFGAFAVDCLTLGDELSALAVDCLALGDELTLRLRTFCGDPTVDFWTFGEIVEAFDMGIVEAVELTDKLFTLGEIDFGDRKSSQ